MSAELLNAKIKNFSYQKYLRKELENHIFVDINILPSASIVSFSSKEFALSKWVSPKRTRSYPYARVYDTFDCDVSKVVTIIPIIKDEGSNGDMDYLQWDTLSLMSLLNVYVILAFYDKAEIHRMKQNKITNQKFHNGYIKQELEELCNYHQSALHWNLNQLKQENLSLLIESAKQSYANISKSLNCTLHNPQNIDKFVTKITQSKDSFMEFSRSKAQMAQNREIHTTQPKEFIGIGKKDKNYDTKLFRRAILFYHR